MNFVDSLSEKGRANWPEIYQRLTGKKWENPTKDKRGIKCETKLESLEEIDKLMRQKPNYTIDTEGRER
jgi:hypothetical protein